MKNCKNILILLVVISCGLQSALAVFERADEKTHYGIFLEINHEIALVEQAQTYEVSWENQAYHYETASDVVRYVTQNPWTKFDPLGLRERTKEDDKSIDALKDHKKDIDKGTQNLKKEREQRVKDGLDTEGIDGRIKRNELTAKGVDELVDKLIKEISDVPDGEEDPIELRIKLEGLKVWNDGEEGAKYDPKNTNCPTCNLFVYDILKNSGIKPPTRFGWSGIGPKGSGEWFESSGFKTKDLEQGGKGFIKHSYSRDGKTGEETNAQNLSLTGVMSYDGHVAINLGDGLTMGSTQRQPVTGSGKDNSISIIYKADNKTQKAFNVDVPNR